MINLYWAVYKNLERETLELSNQIHFDDAQLNIYSIKIADLLIRCSVEIEAISKDLYDRLGGPPAANETDLYFDTDCLQLLENKWLLSKKRLILSAANFYFESENNRIISPLAKAYRRGTSGSKWKQAYQAVKHNRVKNLKYGNIKNLLHALGALFMLNIYYKDEVFSLEQDSKATSFPVNMGSEIFAIKLHSFKHYGGDHNYGKGDDFDECIYLIKYTDNTLENNKKAIEEMQEKQYQLFIKHPKVLEYLDTNRIQDYTGSNFWFDVLGKDEYIKVIQKAGVESLEVLYKSEFEAVLNKNTI